MKTFTLEKIKSIQDDVSHIRNICILAHVDHGKTTLADYLIASNGIISLRLAGKSRYMDSRPDEQQRGITMKSSSIALGHSIDDQDYLVNVIDSPGHVDFCGEVSTAIRLCDGALIIIDVVEGLCAQTKTAIRQAWIEMIKPILVLNKIDRLIMEKQLTPIDAYVHLQQILEQVNALMGEFYNVEVLEEDEEDDNAEKSAGKRNNQVDNPNLNNDTDEATYDWSTGLDDKDDSNYYFAPEQGNVVFASALDGWGFTIQDFAKWISGKHGFKVETLNKTLWGDYYLNSKTKRIMKGAQAKAKKPLFVSMILENIWSIYDSVMIRRDKLMTDKIISTLDLTLHRRDVTHNDPRVVLQSILTHWLCLAPNLLTAVCTLIPSPLELTGERAEKLMCSNTTRFELFPQQTKDMKDAFLHCSKDGPTIVCISKMFPVEKNTLPQYKPKPLTQEEIAHRRDLVKAAIMSSDGRSISTEEDNDYSNRIRTTPTAQTNDYDEDEIRENIVFLAFARVFSGTLKSGDQLYVLHPKHDVTKITSDTMIDPSAKLTDLKTDQHITCAKVDGLYILMGRGLASIDSVGSGNIVGIAGLEDHVIKSATLSNSIYCPPFIDLHVPSQPILRVAIEPVNPIDMGKLIKGLKLLNQSDPCVEVRIQDSGEHVIITTGEIHMQKCVDDLVNKFAGIEVNVSAPIVPFRETIVALPTLTSDQTSNNSHVLPINGSHNSSQSSEITSSSQSLQTSNSSSTQKCTVIVNGDEILQDSEGFLILTTPNKKSTIKIKAVPLPEEVVKLLEVNCDLIKKVDDINKNRSHLDHNLISSDLIKRWNEFKDKLSETLSENSIAGLKENFECIWSFGPKYCGPNILFNAMDDFPRSLWSTIYSSSPSSVVSPSLTDDIRSDYEYSFISGFQLASFSGPLCEEPMYGVAFIIKSWTIEPTNQLASSSTESDPYGPFTGQIMSTVKDGCRKAFQAQPQRLMAAMYSCTIQVTSEALGKMYAVIRRRHGRTIHGDMQQGSSSFTVTAILPVIESFQFANEIRKQTSGMALPQLVFSHWEVIDIDPFWVPTTEEEYELYGEKADTENRARIYMNSVRKRKGLPVDEKIVEHAEKQRTFKRNK
ncbi:elongation factor-like GTPase 1 [Tetranychus urticae]|uniref:Ribosome assembly protein 1 n=1 Tax=Tetranychus urticae TaxID=32264 RepID=T1JST1_TETUR|nr:elongation factor-like GTPase 1 [Tetranychus urticae]